MGIFGAVGDVVVVIVAAVMVANNHNLLEGTLNVGSPGETLGGGNYAPVAPVEQHYHAPDYPEYYPNQQGQGAGQPFSNASRPHQGPPPHSEPNFRS